MTRALEGVGVKGSARGLRGWGKSSGIGGVDGVEGSCDWGSNASSSFLVDRSSSVSGCWDDLDAILALREGMRT